MTKFRLGGKPLPSARPGDASTGGVKGPCGGVRTGAEGQGGVMGDRDVGLEPRGNMVT